METLLKKISILVTDDHPMFRDSICCLVKYLPFVNKVDEATDGSEAIELAKKFHYDIVFMDISMKPMNGLIATLIFKKRFPKIKIIAISQHSEDRYILEMFQNGASAYLIKNADKHEIVEALNAVLNNEMYFSKDVSKTIIDKIKLSNDVNGNLKIEESHSHQETLRNIIFLICHEKKSSQIGEILSLSKRTVEHYRTEILKLSNAENIAGIIRYAVKNRIDEDEILMSRFSKHLCEKD